MKIETKAVEVLLNGNHILKGIDLNINDRELVGIIGRSEEHTSELQSPS